MRRTETRLRPLDNVIINKFLGLANNWSSSLNGTESMFGTVFIMTTSTDPMLGRMAIKLIAICF